MTWTRLDDGWTDQATLADLSFEDRWHYLALIQHCSRTDKLDGVIRGVDARRCSDHPDTASAIANLNELGLLEVLDKDRYKVVRIDDHVPPPHIREKAEQDKLRQRRNRAHKVGDHSLCKPESNCVTGIVTRDVGRDVGTGRDGTGREQATTPKRIGLALTPTEDWDVVEPGTVGELSA